jgi:hypothetical protein
MDLTQIVNELPQAVADLETEVKYVKWYAIGTAIALGYLVWKVSSSRGRR